VITPSDILAGLALLVSGFATFKTIDFSKKQQAVNKVQERLNHELLRKEYAELETQRKADFGAAFSRVGSSNYRLKVFNKGRGAARHVSLEFPEGNHCFDEHDIASKFPLEVLEPQQGVDLIAIMGMDSRRKYAIRVVWSDDFSPSNDKTLYPTVS
jgi:hypothetical protein